MMLVFMMRVMFVRILIYTLCNCNGCLGICWFGSGRIGLTVRNGGEGTIKMMG